MSQLRGTAEADKSSNSSDPARPGDGKSRHRWIIFVTGPTACGKSTVAKYVADKIHAKYLEGDDFHPKANIEKMQSGEPLSDEDRAGWLKAIEDHAAVHPRGPGTHHLVVTCSALKADYREALREGSRRAEDVRILFLFLDAPQDVLTERAAERKGHYAGPDLVHSQFEILERPGPDEDDVVTIDVKQPVDSAEQDALRVVEGRLET